MTELAIPEARAVALPVAQLPVPAMNDIDSWTEIVGKVIRLANEIYDTPFVPDGLRGSAAAVSACILAGREMGLGPMTSLANIDVIRGKPAQKPLLMRAMIQSRGHKWEEIEVSDTRVVVRGCRKGESEWTTATFTADQAKKAGIDLGKYPADKLYARASSRLAKRKFADVIMGMAYSSDEVEDGAGDDEIGTLTEGAPAAIEAPKPRTAQRRKPAEPADRPTGAGPAPASEADSGPAAPAPARTARPEALPPLPGEEEAADPTAAPPQDTASPPSSSAPGELDPAPGTVTSKQITAIWTILTKEFGFADAEKEQARTVCAHIAGRDLASTTMLSKAEAGTIIDTLGHWQYGAEKEQQHPRDYMTSVMIAQDPDAAAVAE